MQCIAPITVIKLNGTPCLAGCGQCMPCRVNTRRQKANRILLELRSHEKVAWLTLTYDDDHLVKVGDRNTLEPKHLTDYWKRLRKAGLEFKYYAVGEYGSTENTERPHYHVFIFGVDGSEPLLQAKWPHGYVFVGRDPKTSDIAEYTASYVEKKLTKANMDKDDKRCPEFTRSSKNPAIGFKAAMVIATKLGNEISKIYRRNGNHLTPADIERLEAGISTVRHGQKSYPIDPWLKRQMVSRVQSLCPFMFSEVVQDQKLRATWNAYMLVGRDEWRKFQWSNFQRANQMRKQHAKSQKI